MVCLIGLCLSCLFIFHKRLLGSRCLRVNVWVDAQLPPALANWLTDNFDLKAAALRELELREAQDIEIFDVARTTIAQRQRWLLLGVAILERLKRLKDHFV